MGSGYQWTYADYVAYCHATSQPVLISTPTEDSFDRHRTKKNKTRDRLRSSARRGVQKISQKMKKIKKQTKKAVQSGRDTLDCIKSLANDPTLLVLYSDATLIGDFYNITKGRGSWFWYGAESEWYS